VPRTLLEVQPAYAMNFLEILLPNAVAYILCWVYNPMVVKILRARCEKEKLSNSEIGLRG
jgi:hypothetical protein